MHQDQVGDAVDRVPLHDRLQAAGIIVAGHAEGRVTVPLVDAETGVVGAAVARVRSQHLARADDAVPHSRRVARTAGGVLRIHAGAERGAAFDRDGSTCLQRKRLRITTQVVVLLGEETAAGDDQQDEQGIPRHVVSSMARVPTMLLRPPSTSSRKKEPLHKDGDDRYPLSCAFSTS